MPQTPASIRPRVTDARAYEAALRSEYLRPFLERIQRRLAAATGTTDVYHALDAEMDALTARPRDGVPVEFVEEQIAKLDGYHRQRLIQTFRAALSVDVRPFLSRPAGQEFVREKVAENVSLIKTIPPRFHDGLRERVAETFAEAPFDQLQLRKLFRDEYRSAGYNLRRLTRDQANKMVGGLSELRHGQLGISRFTWRDVADERVRRECRQDSGNVYEWAKGSPRDGAKPGSRVQCRCTAEPKIDQADLERLGGRGTVTARPAPKPKAFPAKGSTRKPLPKRDERKLHDESAFYIQNRIAAAQRDALSAYSRGPDRLNTPLRSGMKPPPEVARDIARVKKVIAENPVKPPARVYRGIDAVRAGIGNPKVGDVITLDGFASTSVDPSVAASFGHKVLEIKPKRGVYIKPVSGYKSENEWLMDEGRRYRVVGLDRARLSGGTDRRARPIVQLEEID